jgi:outer membrane protein with beta-barrel domain
LRKALVVLFSVLLVFAFGAQAQEFHGAFGFGTVKAPAATTNSNGSFPSLSGGLYPSFSGIFLLKRHIGFGGEVAWRARQTIYGGSNSSAFIVQPYRPIFYDFNAVYGSTFHKKVGADVMAGIGGEDLRFYTPFFTCGFTSCTNYVSSNHFAWHFGGDIRYYFWGHAFVRPEVHYYVVHNNKEFNDANVARFAVSIGYSFMPGF